MKKFWACSLLKTCRLVSCTAQNMLDLPQVVLSFLSDEVGETSDETTCLACMNSNLICILLAGNYCDDVSKINGS